MKAYLILLCSTLLFFSASYKSSENTLRSNGVYVGKIDITQQRGTISEYHYIVFKADGKANTYVLNSPDIDKVSAMIKNNEAASYSGEYRVHEGNITYRSNNSIGKEEKPSTPLFIFYKGKINENGSITLEAMFNDNSKSSATFDFQSLK